MQCLQAQHCLDHDDGEFMILMNSGKARNCPQRRRFTMAHELGHYFLQHHSDALAKGQIPRSNAANGHLGKLLAESEASYFASCLLVPDEALRPTLAKTDPWTEAISKLAEIFEVSMQCAAIRCVQLAGIPCAIIMVPSQVQKPPWLEVSAGMQKWGVTRGSKLKRPAWYKSGFAKTCCLGDWIDTTPEDSAGKAVYQDSKRLGRHGDLVLLYADECRDWGV